MVERIKKCLYLFTSLVFVLLSCSVGLSNPTKAVDLSQNVGYLGQISVTPYIQMNTTNGCNFNNSVSVPYMYNDGTQTSCTNNITYYLPNMTFNRDYIFEINLFIYEIRDRESIHAYINSNPDLSLRNSGGAYILNGEYMGNSVNNVSESSAIISYYFRFPVNGNYTTNNNVMWLTTKVGLKQNEYLMTSTTMPLWAKENLSVVVDNTGVITAINNMSQNLGQKLEYLDGWLAQIAQNTEKMDQMNNTIEEQKDEAEQQGQQSQTDADQAGSDVEGSTTNLLSAITGFFGAFTSATATTCRTDWGIEGFRNFDFCGTQIPTELRVVFTIVASIIFIPMIWFLITSILNAFREFQQ